MPKISEYTNEPIPNEESYLVASFQGVTNKFKTKEIVFLAYRAKMAPQVSEFLGASAIGIAPFAGTSLLLGTAAQIASIADHPGIWKITSVIGINSGYVFSLGSTILIGGGEVAECIIRPESTTSLLVYAGFVDADPPTTPTDGVWINIVGTTLTGKTANNGSISTTASSLVVAAASWYRLKVVVNPAATLVTFYVYNMVGTLLWSDTLATNIPTAAGRETDMRIAAIKTAVTATDMLSVDWGTYWSTDVQTR